MPGCFRFASRNRLIHDRCSCWILFWTCREGAFQAAQKSEVHHFEVLFTLIYYSEARNSVHFLRLSLKSYRDCGLMDRIHLTSTMPSLSYQIHPRSARHCQSHSFTTCRVLGNGLAGSFPSLFGTLNIYHLLAAKKCTHIEIACPVLPEDFFCHVQRAQRRQALR